MRIISPFDPWKSALCTCPKKYSLNPYTGCSHRCIYCYATYIPNFFNPRPKKDIEKRLKKDLSSFKEKILVSLSNSSDPYIPEEKIFKNTRKALEILKEYGASVLIVTKSNLVLRDLDLLKEMKVSVSFTITTLNPKIFKKLEPFASSSQKRLQAIKVLKKAGIKVSLRLDPIFPYLTEEEIETIIRKAKEAGVEHIVSSTFKPRKDGWLRFKKAFPKVAKKLEPLYFKKGERIQNAWYLPKEMRKKLMIKVKKACDKAKISFACCREGFPELNTAESCDGSHLIKK